MGVERSEKMSRNGTSICSGEVFSKTHVNIQTQNDFVVEYIIGSRKKKERG
jgi:hypothetical protein